MAWGYSLLHPSSYLITTAASKELAGDWYFQPVSKPPASIQSMQTLDTVAIAARWKRKAYLYDSPVL